MARETEMFFESIVREDHNILDLLDADFSFVTKRWRHGIDGVEGESTSPQLPANRGGL